MSLPTVKSRVAIWWIVWGGILLGLIAIYEAMAANRPLPAPSTARLLSNLSGFVPLFVSIVIRWLVLPRAVEPARALVIFIVGIALAEACGVLGIVLGGPYRDALFVLGVLGVVQYAPFYARRLYEPRGSGFIPNN